MAKAYLLSAEVVLELLRGDVSSAQPVRKWMESAGRATLHVSALGLAWIRSDIEAIADPVRRDALREDFEKSVVYRFEGRTIHLDDLSLRRWGVIRGQRVGDESLSTEEALEAAIALANNFILVARDTELRRQSGVSLEDPWAAE
jgi:predicted nucleic acid-binding protein